MVTLLKRIVLGLHARFGATTAIRALHPSFWFVSALQNADDDTKIQDFNYEATKLSIKRAVAGEPKASEVLSKRGSAGHPFAAHD